ncbi:MAG: lycopene cyclase domain-containing protein [Prolixibacteraceae bacterium]|jgi:lycopene cyclase domain-containing protein|nr:lycopene cyclase domain-containing protein [Prolixibacteraceae bacterium]
MKNYIFLAFLALICIASSFCIFCEKYGLKKKLRYGIPSVLISGIMFLLWDIRFTQMGVWNYHTNFTMGIFYKGLPLEQWLFYLVFPLAGWVVYEMVKTRFGTLDLGTVFTAVGLLMVAGLAVAAYLYRNQAYTFSVSLFTAVYLGYTIFRKQFQSHITHFFLTYIVLLVPYFLLNGMLSWNLVIEYHQEQVINIRVWMMPVENSVFLFLLMLIGCTVYEYFSERRSF